MPSSRGSSRPTGQIRISYWQAGSLPLVSPGKPSWERNRKYYSMQHLVRTSFILCSFFSIRNCAYIYVWVWKLEAYLFLIVQCSKEKKNLKTLGWSNLLILQNQNSSLKRNIFPEVIGPAFAIAQRDSWLRFFSTGAILNLLSCWPETDTVVVTWSTWVWGNRLGRWLRALLSKIWTLFLKQ